MVHITRKRINRGGGFGLEAPCIFRLYRADALIGRLKELVDASGGAARDVDPEKRSQPDRL